MIGDYSSDIIGTNPQLPPIVDHSWLDVDLSKYDNYPSDNNPVRIVPKLSELWNTNASQTGVNLVPNAKVMPLGVRSSEEDSRVVQQITREAKKAAMAGLKGKSLIGHLRARFAAKHLEMAQEELKKVAEEVGLLGNVYIDASAFNSYDEAEQFIRQNRNRLAREVLMNTTNLNPNVVSMLASNFHKNVVASITYDEKLLNKYKAHLVQAGLPADFVIDSKETLRAAFLYEKKAEKIEDAPKKEEKMDEEKVKEALDQMNAVKEASDRVAQDISVIAKVSPILSFVQENLSKGKTASALKEMMKSKFVMNDIKTASEYLAIVLSKDGLSETHIDELVSQGRISKAGAKELKKIGKKFPIKKAKYADPIKEEHTVGVKGYFYSLNSTPETHQHDTLKKASIVALKKGIEIEIIKAGLLKKMSSAEADKVLSEAVIGMNSSSVGAVANIYKAPKKVALVPDATPVQTLPDPSTIAPQSDELISMFKNSGNMDIEFDAAPSYENLEVLDLFNRSGIDETL